MSPLFHKQVRSSVVVGAHIPSAHGSSSPAQTEVRPFQEVGGILLEETGSQDAERVPALSDQICRVVMLMSLLQLNGGVPSIAKVPTGVSQFESDRLW